MAGIFLGERACTGDVCEEKKNPQKMSPTDETTAGT